MEKDQEAKQILFKILNLINRVKLEDDKQVTQVFVNDYIYNALIGSKFHTIKDDKNFINMDLELIHDEMVPLTDVKVGSSGIKYRGAQIIRK